MQTALIRTDLTNAHVKLDTLAMDTHVQVQLIFLTQDDHECVSPLTVLAHLYARSPHDTEFRYRLKQNLQF